MKQADYSLAAMFAGDERRPVLQRRPALGREHRIGLGQHLPADRDILRHGKARERTVGGERGEMLRFLPGQAAAERAAAAAQLDRHQIVVALRQTRAGKAHQDAALVDPGGQAFAKFRRQRADIRHHDHGQLLVEKLGDRLLRSAAIAEPDIRERRQRPCQIEDRRQQRLRGIAGRAADDADRSAPPPLIQKLNRAGRPLTRNLKTCDIVAQLDRKIESRFRLKALRREVIAGFGDRRALGVERAHDTGGDAAVGAQHLDRHLRRGVFGRRQRQGRGNAAIENRKPAVCEDLAQALDELRAASGVDAVGQPGDLGVAGCLQEAFDRGKDIDPIDRIGLGRELPQRHPRRARRHDRDVARGLRKRDERDAAPVGIGIGDQFVGGLDAGVPVRCRAPAVVQQDHQWRLAAGEAGLRIPDRAGRRQDDERCGGEPQHRQPPWRARGSFLLWRDVEQQPRRRKFDAPRPRRHHSQQPPQERQAEEAQQHQRFGEGEGEASDHALRPTLTPARAVPLLTIIPPCRNSSNSAAERLVVWVANSQSSLLVSSRIWSRCSATRAT